MRLSKKTLTPFIKTENIGLTALAEIVGAEPTETDKLMLFFKIGKTTYKKAIGERLQQLLNKHLGDETDNWGGSEIILEKRTFDKDGEVIEYVDITDVKPNEAKEDVI